MSIFLELFDQLRYMGGFLVILYLFCNRTLDHREHYFRRLAAGAAVCLLVAFLYVPLRHFLQPWLEHYPFLIGPYWLIVSCFPLALILFCYDTTVTSALYRTMFASLSENMAALFTRNLMVYALYPGFPEEHPYLYMMAILGFYIVFFQLVYWCIAGRVQVDEIGRHGYDRKIRNELIISYLLYFLIMESVQYALEYMIQPISQYTEMQATYRQLMYFLIFIHFMINTTIIFLLWFLHQHMAVQTEKELIARLARERQTQYEFSRETIDMINTKSHDLKHQLLAMASMKDEERKKQILEATRTVEFYDAVVRTGNNAVDTLLTEKNVYCKNRSIHLSCTVHSEKLKRIELIDLYTLLGNALDNAIEGVERLQNPEKKIISLSILDQGGMLYIQVENYYDGELQMHNGVPQSRKQDMRNHGFGIQSMKAIIRKYGGNMNIQTEDELFNLEILLPV